MKIAIIFPPFFDPSMPYLAPYQLKAYLAKYRPSCDINVYDLNILFFNSIIKNPYINFNHDTDKAGTYCAIIECEKKITKALSQWSNIYNVNITRQNSDYSFDESNSSEFKKFLAQRTPFETAIEQILRKNVQIKHYELFCISVTTYEQLLPSLLIAKAIKAHNSNITICFGGNIISRIYKGLINSRILKNVDFIIIKEGEIPITNLVDFLSKEEIKTLTNCLIDASTGQIIDKTNNPAILQLDNLPIVKFNREELPLYFSPELVLPISLSRGCSWRKCSYCGIHSSWCYPYRKRSSKKLTNEIEHHLTTYSTNKFRLVDESPALSDLLSFSEIIIQNNFKICIEAYLNLSKTLSDRQKSLSLYNAGFRQFFFGIESVNNELLKEIGKEINHPELYSDILQGLHEVGISNYSFIMIGLPNDNIKNEIAIENFLLRNNDIDTIAISSFIPLSNSPMYSDESFKKKYSIDFTPRGDLTTRCNYTINGNDISRTIEYRAKQMVTKVFLNRKDLFLSSNIPYEARFYLINRFGNNCFKEMSLTMTLPTNFDNLSSELDGRLTGLK